MKMRSKTSFPRRRGQHGFTLIELIIVITLIAAVTAVVASKVIENKKRAEAKLAKTQLNSLAAQVDQFESDVGTLPESLQDLVSSSKDGWLGPYARATEFQDPWHNAIEYRKPGTNDSPFSLTSLGADGKPGGEGVDKDVVAP